MPLAVASVLVSTPLAAQQRWGTGSFEDEATAYSALVKQLEGEADQLRLRIQQVEKDGEAFLGRYPAGRRQELEQEYERHADNINRRELHFRAQEKEQAAKNLYDDARAALTPAQERAATVRENLWTKHVSWLRRRIETLEARLAWRDSKLVVMRGLEGVDWEAFWAQNREDALYVFKDALANFAQDVYKCIMDLGSQQIGGYLGRSVGPQPLVSAPRALVPDVLQDFGENCVVGPALGMLVSGFEAAWRRHFLDDMKARGVLEGVAEYWWNEIIAAKLADDSVLRDGVTGFLAEQAEKTAQESYTTYVGQLANVTFAESELSRLKERYVPLAAQARSASERADLTGKVLEAAKKSGEDRTKDLSRAAKLTVDYSRKAAELYLNSQTFSSIETNELVRYERIVTCLRARGETVDAPTVIAVLKRDAGGYASFLGECRAEPGQQVDLRRIREILDRLRSLAGSTRGRVTKAEADCASARSGLSAAEAKLADLGGRLTRLESERAATTPAGDPAALVAAYERDAYAAGLKVVESKQKIEAIEGQACGAADQVATAGTAAARTQSLAAAAVAARQAATHERLVADYAAQSAAAARSAAALLRQMQGAGAEPAQRQSDLAEVEMALSDLERALAAAARAAQQAVATDAETALAKAEAAGLYDEGRRTLTPLRAQPERAQQLTEIEGLFAHFRGLGVALGACSGDLAQASVGPAAQVDSLKSRLKALHVSAGPARAAVDAPQALIDAVDRARASADTAEIYASATEAIAQRAQACRERAEAAARTPLTPQRDVPTGWGAGAVRDDGPANGQDSGTGESAASTGWGSGQITEGAGQRTGAQPSARVSGLADAVVDAVDRCQYDLARDLLGRILDQDPQNAWALGHIGEVTEWSRRVETSEQALTQATDQLGRGSLEGAFGALATARANSSPCAQPSIDAVWGQLQQERGRRERAAQEESAQRDRVTQQAAQAAQQEKARREQEVLTELIGTMTNALTTLSAAKGGKGRPPAVGLPGGQVNECPPGQIWVDNSVLGQGTAGCVEAASSTPKATPSEPPCGRYSNECCCWDRNHRPYRMYYNFDCNHPNLAFRDYICVPRRPQVMKQATQ